MPTYEYECPNGHKHEVWEFITKFKRELPCPECGETARLLIGPGGGFIFKGPGFYVNDYGRGR